MPNRNKRRGYELEAACRDFWIANGFTARRTLASGAYKQQLGDEHAADLWIEDFSVEAKRKKFPPAAPAAGGGPPDPPK